MIQPAGLFAEGFFGWILSSLGVKRKEAKKVKGLKSKIVPVVRAKAPRYISTRVNNTTNINEDFSNRIPLMVSREHSLVKLGSKQDKDDKKDKKKKANIVVLGKKDKTESEKRKSSIKKRRKKSRKKQVGHQTKKQLRTTLKNKNKKKNEDEKRNTKRNNSKNNRKNIKENNEKKSQNKEKFDWSAMKKD